MIKPVRVAALAGAAFVLLAAGNAPEIGFGFSDEAAMSEWVDMFAADTNATTAAAVTEFIPAPQIVETTFDLGEPHLGPVLPEAESLSELVSELRGNESLATEDFERGADLHCLATAVYFESKSEPLDGQLAVAQVILNRVESSRFHEDICGVVKAPYQFSFVRKGKLPEATNEKQWATARAIAWIAISEGWKEIVPAATHFHATRVRPGWAKLHKLATVGNHIFYGYKKPVS